MHGSCEPDFGARRLRRFGKVTVRSGGDWGRKQGNCMDRRNKIDKKKRVKSDVGRLIRRFCLVAASSPIAGETETHM